MKIKLTPIQQLTLTKDLDIVLELDRERMEVQNRISRILNSWYPGGWLNFTAEDMNIELPDEGGGP